MKKVWEKVRGVLGGGFILPTPFILIACAFGTYGLNKPTGIVFGILAIISSIVSIAWVVSENRKNKKGK